LPLEYGRILIISRTYIYTSIKLMKFDYISHNQSKVFIIIDLKLDFKIFIAFFHHYLILAYIIIRSDQP